MDLVRYQVDITGLTGGPGVATFHADLDLFSASDQDIADIVETFFNGFETYITSGISFRGQDHVDHLNPADGKTTSSQGVDTWDLGGANAATALPPTVQMLIRWETGVYINGRRLQGKTFLPGFCEDSNEPGGTPQSAVRTVVLNAANTVWASEGGFGVYSKRYHEFHPTNAASVWAEWAILRGRRDG